MATLIYAVDFDGTLQHDGNSAETSVFKIHYAKDGIHIVPDYPSKKR